MDARASLSSSLATLEQVRDQQATFLEGKGVAPDAIAAFRKLIDHQIRNTLDLAVAVKKAATGDPSAAREMVMVLDLDRMAIR
jgi:hypothetical protein